MNSNIYREIDGHFIKEDAIVVFKGCDAKHTQVWLLGDSQPWKLKVSLAEFITIMKLGDVDL